jgi:hypothetical protein
MLYGAEFTVFFSDKHKTHGYRCGSLEEQAHENVGSQYMFLLGWPASSSLVSLSLNVMLVGGFGTGNSAL